jgi:hypothetical protein
MTALKSIVFGLCINLVIWVFAYATYASDPKPSIDASLRNFMLNQEYSHQTVDFSAFKHFITHLEESRGKKSELDFAKNIFNRTHRNFLNRYKINSSFGDLLYTGNFDCVSGTALLSVIYEQLGFNAKIIETPFHVFLELHIEGKKVIIESTDPQNGFIYQSQKQEIFYKGLEKNAKMLMTKQEWNLNPGDFYKELNKKELALLQWYNEAIESYNTGNFVEAFDAMGLILAQHSNQKYLDFYERVFFSLIESGALDIESSKRAVSQYRNITALK